MKKCPKGLLALLDLTHRHTINYAKRYVFNCQTNSIFWTLVLKSITTIASLRIFGFIVHCIKFTIWGSYEREGQQKESNIC